MPRLTRDRSTEENREFWNFVERTADEVRRWPAWKRGQADPSDVEDFSLDASDEPQCERQGWSD